jgi:hypothetical protein
MKLTSVEHAERSQLIPGVMPTDTGRSVMTSPWLKVPLALTSGLVVAATDASAFNGRDEQVVVVLVERAERCLPVSPAGLPRHPKSRGDVFLRVEVGGAAAQDPHSLTADTVVLRSRTNRWRSEAVAIGVPAGDPLGARTRGPLLLFQVPRDTRHFNLKMRDGPEVTLEAEGPPRQDLTCF